MNDFQKYLSLQLQKADRDLHDAQQSVKNYTSELADLQQSMKTAQENLSRAQYMAENHRRVYEAEMRRDPVVNAQ